MATIFWIGSDDDLIKAHELAFPTDFARTLEGGNTNGQALKLLRDARRPGDAVGVPSDRWSFVESSNVGATWQADSTLILNGNANHQGRLNLANTVWLAEGAAGRKESFWAERGIDEYIIDSSFSQQAATGEDTVITIIEEGVNTFRFRQGVQISSVTLNEHHLEISFGDSTHKALILENVKKAKFKIGNTSDVELTLGAFLKLTENASTTAPYMVADGFAQTDVPTGVTEPDLSDATKVTSLTPARTVVHDRDSSSASSLWAYGTLEITDSDGISLVSVTTAGRYGTLTTRRDGDTDRWNWTYILVHDGTLTRELEAGTDEDTITLTITDKSPTPVQTTHNITVGIRIIDIPDNGSFIDDEISLVIHGVKFVAYDHDYAPLGPGAGIGLARNNSGMGNDLRRSDVITRPRTEDGAFGHVYNLKFGDTNIRAVTSQILADLWNSRADLTRDIASATVIEELGAINVADYIRGTGDFTSGNNPNPVLYARPDRTVKLDHDNPDNNDVEAHGVLAIKDTDGVGTVTATGATYGTFDIPQNGTDISTDGMSGNWNWTYTLNTRDHDTRILREGQHRENITLNVADINGMITVHTYTITITVAGTAPDPNKTFIYETEGADTTVEYDYTEGATNDNLTASGTLNITDANGIASVLESTDAPTKYGDVTITPDGDDYTWTYTLNPDSRATRALSDLATDMHTETITLIITDMDDPATVTMREITVGVMITGTAPEAETTVAPSSDEDTEVTLDLYPQIQPGGTAAHEPMAGGTLTLTNIDGVDTVVESTTAPAKYGTFAITREAGTDDWEWTYTLDANDVDTAALTTAETETITLTITDLRGNTDTHTFDIAIGVIVNEPPTATLMARTVGEEDTLAFALADVMFTDPNVGDALVSIVIVSLPDPEKGVLTLGGVPVAAGDVIMADALADPGAGRAGKFVFTPPDTMTTEFATSFDIKVRDMGGLESAPTTWDITITATDSPPKLNVKNTLAIEVGDGAYVLTRYQIAFRDPDTPDKPLPSDIAEAMLTLTQITGGMLEVYNTATRIWEMLAVGGTFTQEQVNDGHVRLVITDSMGSFTISGMYGANPATTQTINFSGRVKEDLMATEIGLPEVELGDDTQSKRITTGIGKTRIKPGKGDDRVDGGLGDDVIDLSAGGEDTVIYRFETGATGATIAWGGGDDITGFTPGEDRLLLDEIGGDGRGDFLDGLGKGFFAGLATAYAGDGSQDRADLANYNVTGIEIHFSQAVVLPGGGLGGAVLTIHFAEPIDWADFNSMWLTPGAFDTDELLFNANTAGRAALRALLRLDMVAPSNGWGATIYRFATDDDGTPIPWSGDDTIRGFTPGEDELLVTDIGGGGDAFIDNLGEGFVATLTTAYGGTGDRASLTNYNVTGVEIHFSQAILLPGGVLGGSILTIAFAAPIAWAGENGFNMTYFGGAAGPGETTPFDTDELLFNDNDAGKAALARILGLRDAEASDRVSDVRSVAIGDDGDNTIDLTGESGGWVIDGGGGNDEITLGDSMEEVIYRLAVGSDDPIVITTPDGNDEVRGFALGEDRLTFVDTDGTPPTATPATNDTPEISAVDKLMAAFDSVSLNYNGSGYTGITFGIDAAATLQVTFAEALAADALADKLGSTIADAAALGTIFASGVAPTTANAPTALSTAGLALIDTLFGMTGDENNISIGASLPAELL